MFGVFTVLTALAQDMTSLLLIRFLTGLGLGGATPSFVSLTSEYAPPRLRRLVVALLWAGIPLGGALGGALASLVIPTLGWRALFFVGGGLPLALSVILMLFLPESLNFLMTSNAGADHIFSILRRIAPSHARQQHYILGEPKLVGTPMRQLFADGRGFGTVLLWGLFFLLFLVLVTNTAWSPTLLSRSGLAPAQIGWIMAASNGGAVLGALVIGLLMQRNRPYRVLTAALVAGGVCFTLFGLALPSFGLVSLLQGVVQLLVGGSASGAVAVAAMLYPTSVRSTGVGWATGFGRLGSFFGPLAAGALVTAHVTTGIVYAALGVLGVGAALFVLMLGREQHRRGVTSRTASG
jgi:AAHS family 4-hydroxybenzoate transporter-like MFS transporter